MKKQHLPEKNLYALFASFYLAQKMATLLGGSQILF